MLPQGPIDVLVLGGGLAGLTLARSLPDRRVVVVDPRGTDPARRRLGESLTEVSSFYLESLGLAEHLREQHVRKLALRFFLGTGPLSERAEFGVMGEGAPPATIEQALPSTWQVHRGRLEHHLAQGLEVVHATATFDGGVRIDGEPVDATWVVDATARGVVPGARRDLPHAAQAAWFWVEQAIDVDELGLPPRCAPHVRERATTHLMGPGGWVWVIRLADGSTSIGIVRPPGPAFSGVDSALAWLARREPELHAALDAPVDFAQAAWTAHMRPLIERPGLARIGDAAGFLDPLYSSGADLIAIGNGLVASCIRGQVDPRRANTVFDGVRGQYVGLYEGIFGLLASPRALLARTVWDQAVYFGFLALLGRGGSFAEALSDGLWHARAVKQLQDQTSQALRAWAAVDTAPAGHVDQPRVGALNQALERLRVPCRGRRVRAALDANLGLLEQLAVAIWCRAERACGRPVPAMPVNPYGLASGEPHVGVRRVGLDPDVLGPLERAWS